VVERRDASAASRSFFDSAVDDFFLAHYELGVEDPALETARSSPPVRLQVVHSKAVRES
jgi:hypothetical protein